jgi:UDP-N-acetylglucosamine:LPS N-acetylglucosamine transferase
VINDVVVDSLPKLLDKYQIIHQTGKKTFDQYYGRAGVVLIKSPYKSRYKIFPYMNDVQLKMAAGISDLVVARSGAGSIYEIAN